MKRFGSILTFLTSGAFVTLVIYAILVYIMGGMLGQGEEIGEIQSKYGEATQYMTPLVYVWVGSFAASGMLLFFTCLFAFIGICTRKGGIAATSRCALIGLILSAVALSTVLIGTLATKDIAALFGCIAEGMELNYDEEVVMNGLNMMFAAFAGYNLVVFLFGLISNPNLSKKESKNGKKAQTVKRVYSSEPTGREVYSEEDRLNLAAYGSLVGDSTPRTTTRSGYYSVNGYTASNRSYVKKQKKGRCTDAELFSRFNKVLASNGYLDDLGGHKGFPF